MILHTGILAILLASLAVTAMIGYAAFHAVVILDRWDLASGSERQLRLERSTYLISTLVAYAMSFHLLSYFLFIGVSNDIAGQLVGAMCAAGTLHATPYGYPCLLLKTLNVSLAGIWLILNHADRYGKDYPLIKAKYALLLGMVPLLLAETVLQTMHFIGLRPGTITSCCGSLFSGASEGIASEMAAVPAYPMMAVFYASAALTLGTAAFYLRTGRLGGAYGVFSGVNGVVSILALVSFICLYIYEMPTHHCPFCVLQSEYGHVGYFLYLSLLGGSICGIGVGVLGLHRKKTSIAPVLPRIRRRLAAASFCAFAGFLGIGTWPIVFSSLTLGLKESAPRTLSMASQAESLQEQDRIEKDAVPPLEFVADNASHIGSLNASFDAMDFPGILPLTPGHASDRQEILDTAYSMHGNRSYPVAMHPPGAKVAGTGETLPRDSSPHRFGIHLQGSMGHFAYYHRQKGGGYAEVIRAFGIPGIDRFVPVPGVQRG